MEATLAGTAAHTAASDGERRVAAARAAAGDGPRPSFTILVPMYNEERYIASCLDSILAQQHDLSACEILVVDGRSTDRSREIVQEYARRDPRIRLLDNPARTQAAGLNVGVLNARGPYILQMDAHARYHPDYIRQAVQTLERTGAGNVVGVFNPRPGNDSTMARAIWIVQTSRFGAGASYGWRPGPERFIGHNEPVTAGWSFRRDVFEKVGLFDVRPVGNHDMDMSARIFKAGLGVYFNPAIQADYFARTSARAFARTMYRNGHYLVPMWLSTPASFNPMHAVPFAFVLMLLVSALGGLLWKPLRWVGAAAVVPYLVVLLVLTALYAVRHGPVMALLIPWLIPLTHLSYGLGTLTGLIRFGLGGLPPPSPMLKPSDPAAPARLEKT